MKDFFRYLGTLVFSFFSGFGGFLIAHADFFVGLLATVIVFYIIYILISQEGEKASKIVTAIVGLIGGIIAAAAI